MKTFQQIADAVMEDNRIESGLVQQTRARDFAPLTKDKSGIPERRLTHRTTYRVFVCLPKLRDGNPLNGKVNYEHQGPVLMDCVRAVYEKIELPLPGGL